MKQEIEMGIFCMVGSYSCRRNRFFWRAPRLVLLLATTGHHPKFVHVFFQTSTHGDGNHVFAQNLLLLGFLRLFETTFHPATFLGHIEHLSSMRLERLTAKDVRGQRFRADRGTGRTVVRGHIKE